MGTPRRERAQGSGAAETIRAVYPSAASARDAQAVDAMDRAASVVLTPQPAEGDGSGLSSGDAAACGLSRSIAACSLARVSSIPMTAWFSPPRPISARMITSPDVFDG